MTCPWFRVRTFRPISCNYYIDHLSVFSVISSSKRRESGYSVYFCSNLHEQRIIENRITDKTEKYGCTTITGTDTSSGNRVASHSYCHFLGNRPKRTPGIDGMWCCRSSEGSAPNKDLLSHPHDSFVLIKIMRNQE